MKPAAAHRPDAATLTVPGPREAGPAPRVLRGVALVLGAAMLWGTTGTAQSLATAGLPPMWVGSLRLAVSAVFFGLWLALAAPRRKGPALPPAAPWPWPALLAAAGCMGVYNLAFFAGVRASGVAVGTAVALGSGPLWAGVLQALVARRMPAAGWWIATALAVGGGVLMVLGPARAGTGTTASPIGLALCLLAGLSYAVYALINHRLVARVAPARATAVVFAGAALMALPVAAMAHHWPGLTAGDALVVLWLGVMSTGVAYLLFSHALRHLSAPTGVTLALAEPVTAFVLAVVIVGERPGLWAAVGLVVVLAGLLGVVRAELRATSVAPST